MRLATNPILRSTQARSGSIIPLVAVMLLALIVVGGFAIDYTRLQVARTEIRSAADAIARSSATEIALTDSKDAAIAKGIEVASLFRVGDAPFAIEGDAIKFGRRVGEDQLFVEGLTPPNAVQVIATKLDSSNAGSMTLMFGNAFGAESFKLQYPSVATFKIVDICLVLDRSSSMKLDVAATEKFLPLDDPRFLAPPTPASRWAALDTAVSEFSSILEKSLGEEQIGLVTFASDFTFEGTSWPAVRRDLELTANIPSLGVEMNTLLRTVWNGNTFIEAGMMNGIDMLANSPNARENALKIMVVLTDGFENEGSALEAAKIASQNDIIVHTITFSVDADKTLMAQVAAETNGRHAHADDTADLIEVFKDVAAEITTLAE